ncbi:MAG: hypothetical protein OXD34_05785 [bacterium]|nr:hypothetical protein [bacterium]
MANSIPSELECAYGISVLLRFGRALDLSLAHLLPASVDIM